MKSVRLKGEEGERWLRLDEHGLWLMESEDAIDGLDALKETPRYVSGRLKDKLQARGETFGIPAGKGGEVREMIAIARLRGPSHALLTGPFIDTTHELERAFVSGWLEPEEQLLAFLQTTSSLEVGSAVGDASEVEARVVWTDRRAALVAIGPLGDLREHPLVDALIVESVTGRDTVRCGELDWKTTLFNESRYAKLVEVWASPPPERLRFAADQALAAGERDLARRYVGALQDPLARLETTLFDGAELEHADLSLGGFLQNLPPRGRAPRVPPPSPNASRSRQVSGTLAESLPPEDSVARLDVLAWADSWRFDVDARARLRDALLQSDPQSSAGLILDEWLRETHLRKEKDLDAIVRLDVEHARALVRADRHSDARALLEARLATLAPPEAADLIAHGTVGSEREPQLRARATLLEMLHDAGATDARLALARLQPMRKARLVALEREDAARALAVIEEGPRIELPSPPGTRAPFDVESLSLLRHPIGRSDSFVAGIQALVARADVPDHGALRAYCAKLADPAACAIFERTLARMGGKASAYVSQGERALGCRAHDDGEASFVIVGACHLDAEHPRYLPPASLAFAFGAELAHLRFGHSRVTASDLWNGAFAVGVSGFDLLLGAIPLVGRWQGLAEGASKLGNAIKDGSIGTFARRAGRALGWEIPEESEEHLAAGQLLAAHRLMQLTSDRAGLVLAGDPAAAVRAILSVDPSDVWERSESVGLRELVSERDESGALVRADLAVRISALLSFWLSDDYQRLANPSKS